MEEVNSPRSPQFSVGPQRRPIAVGAGFPWFGSFLQILVEFAAEWRSKSNGVQWEPQLTTSTNFE